MNTVEFLIKLKDALSAPLNTAASVGAQAYGRLTTSSDNFRRSNDRVPQSIQQIKNRLNELNQTREISVSRRQITEADREISQLQKKLDRLDNPRSGNGIGSTIRNGLAVGGIAAALALGGSVVSSGMESDQQQTSLKVMLGSAEKAKQMITDIRGMAAATPFGTTDLIASSTTLMQFGMDAKKVLPTMQMLGDASGGNVEKFKSLSLAYAQVQSAGKMQGQDMLQMINAGFNPLTEISKRTGLSMGELRKRMEDGAISSKMVEMAFQSANSEGGLFFHSMDEQSQTIGGRFSTLKDNVQMFGLSVYEAMKPALSAMLDLGNFLLENKEIVLGVALAIGAYALIANGAAIATGLLEGVFWLLDAAMAANPIGLVVAGIVLLAAWMVYAYKKVEWFRGGFMASMEAIKGFAGVIKDYLIDRIKGLLSGFGSIANALKLLFDGKYSEAWDAAKKGMSDISGITAAKNAKDNAVKVIDATKQAYKKGAAEVAAEKAKALKGDKPAAGSPVATKDDWKAAMDAAGSNDKKKKGKSSGALDSDVNGVTGAAGRNTIINLGKFFDNFNLHTQNVTQGMDGLEAKVTEIMLRILNSANQ